MPNYIDKLRVVATLMVFSLHSFLLEGKNFPFYDILKSSEVFFIFLHLHGEQYGFFLY